MAQVVFYAKPGCKGNARQIRVLQASGHEVEVRDLLSEPWTAARLLSFFGDRPAADWFNRSAVRVKSGEIDPDTLNAEDAMALLLADPALIRRPLMAALGEKHIGWEPEVIEGWIGFGSDVRPGKEGCAAGVKALRRAEEGLAADACQVDAAEACQLVVAQD